MIAAGESPSKRVDHVCCINCKKYVADPNREWGRAPNSSQKRNRWYSTLENSNTKNRKDVNCSFYTARPNWKWTGSEERGSWVKKGSKRAIKEDIWSSTLAFDATGEDATRNVANHFMPPGVIKSVEDDWALQTHTAEHVKNGTTYFDTNHGVWMMTAIFRDCKPPYKHKPSTAKQYRDALDRGLQKALKKVSSSNRDGAIITSLSVPVGHPVYRHLKCKGRCGSVKNKTRAQMMISYKNVSLLTID